MITSTGNQQMKNIALLQKKAKARNEQETFIVEGRKMFGEVPREWLKKVYVTEQAAWILEQGDYTRENKARSRLTGAVSAAYWLIATVVFFFYTFGPNGNGQPQSSWFIWAIAGVLYGALIAFLSIVCRKTK